jgi:hypothetical protein
MSKELKLYLGAVGTYFGVTFALWAFYEFDTRVTQYAVSCIGVPQEVKIVLGPISWVECSFNNNSKLYLFALVSLIFCALLAAGTWTKRAWLRAFIIVATLFLWFSIGFVQQISFPVLI